jgi:hypothetical protein
VKFSDRLDHSFLRYSTILVALIDFSTSLHISSKTRSPFALFCHRVLPYVPYTLPKFQSVSPSRSGATTFFRLVVDLQQIITTPTIIHISPTSARIGLKLWHIPRPPSSSPPLNFQAILCSRSDAVHFLPQLLKLRPRFKTRLYLGVRWTVSFPFRHTTYSLRPLPAPPFVES